MKKIFIFLPILFISVLLIACSSSTSAPKVTITPEIEEEIFAITKNVNQISIDRVEDYSTYFTVWVEFLYEPTTTQEIEVFLTAVCEDCYRIAKKHELKVSINVWGFRPKDDDLTYNYGKAHYDRYSGKFEFKTAKELNL